MFQVQSEMRGERKAEEEEEGKVMVCSDEERRKMPLEFQNQKKMAFVEDRKF